MKRIGRHFAASLLALYFVTLIDNGVSIGGGLSVFLYAAVLLTVINTFVKPLLKILFLPINLITLGFFSWVINLIAFYLLTLTIAEISIGQWEFPGFSNSYAVLPPFTLPPGGNFVFASFLLALNEKLFGWLFH